MATHDYNIANGTGQQVRQDINNVLLAIRTNNESGTEPANTFAYMWWIDSTNNLLKLRNGANDAWITVGSSNTANLGLASLASPSFTGTATFAGDVLLSGTGQIDLPAGTEAQRSASPNSGMLRFNTDSNSFEGYNGTAWGSIGGGASGADAVFYENGQTVNTSYTLTANTNAMSAGPITIGSSATVTIGSGQTWVIV